MEKKIAIVRFKMIAVIAIIAALGSWQHEFVMEGISAHVEMNLTILGTFAFSIIIAFIFVSKLKNEVVAFRALKEMWEDIQAAPIEGASDPLWRHRRCRRPARVFRRPRLLGHAYEVVTDEVARTKRIRVSVETMNTLVNTIEHSINDEKSMIVYMSGLLVFMGLIGTFIGLLHMVSAIGGIIGSLAQSGGGSGATAAFQELLAALQQPLKGMASGFASSLFGLFSSLVVGLLGRFAGQAAGVLKREFEAWLASVVQINDDEQDAAKIAIHAPAVTDATLVRMVGGVLADYSRLAGAFDRVAQRLEDMQAAQAAQSRSTEAMAMEIAAFCERQNALIEKLGPVEVAPALRDLGVRIESAGGALRLRLEQDLQHLRAAVDEAGRSQAGGLRALQSQQAAFFDQLAAGLQHLALAVDRRAGEGAPERVAEVVDLKVAQAVHDIGRMMEAQAQGQTGRMAAIERAQERLAHAMQQAIAEAGAPRGDAGLARALERLDQTVATAFSAYSGLLQVSIAALERSDLREPAPRRDAAAQGGR